MKRRAIATLHLLLAASLACPGCAWRPGREISFSVDDEHYDEVATTITNADVEIPSNTSALDATSPLKISGDGPIDYRDVPLAEVVRLALTNSRVLRDLGGAVLEAPQVATTVYDPAIQETDPRLFGERAGVEAALSEFDASYAASAFFEKNDRALNNLLLGGGTRLLRQDLMVFEEELAKTAATGTEFSVGHRTEYDFNNAPGNRFPGAWTTNFDARVRQPLLQGAGVDYNRIAGPAGIPGRYNGVLLARVNTDIRLADFELGVRDLVSNVENAYWDLYYAYRDLDAKVAARDASLETWRRIHALFVAGRAGGEAEKEAQAREQYFRFQEEVENALGGRIFDGTRTDNGSSGGTFRATGGVYVSERRLRLLMGVPASDGQLLRPIDQPAIVKVEFDWSESISEAIARRAELRRQRWQVKGQELRLLASRNFLLPQLDAIGLWRWRGFGRELIDPNGNGKQRFDNAVQDLFTGDFQEWQVGAELDIPLGFRLGHTAVRNAQLELARARAVLDEQEREVVHDLSDAVAEVDRAYTVAQTSYNRRLAAREQLKAVQAAYEGDRAPLDQVLDAQRRLADSETRYHRLLVEYALAVRNVHFEKGSLLDHHEVYLAEGPWPGKAYRDAAQRERLRGRPKRLSYIMHSPLVISQDGDPQCDFQPSCEECEYEVVAPAQPTPTPAEPTPAPAEPLPLPPGPQVGQSTVAPTSAPAEPREAAPLEAEPAVHQTPTAARLSGEEAHEAQQLARMLNVAPARPVRPAAAYDQNPQTAQDVAPQIRRESVLGSEPSPPREAEPPVQAPLALPAFADPAAHEPARAKRLPPVPLSGFQAPVDSQPRSHDSFGDSAAPVPYFAVESGEAGRHLRRPAYDDDRPPPLDPSIAKRAAAAAVRSRQDGLDGAHLAPPRLPDVPILSKGHVGP